MKLDKSQQEFIKMHRAMIEKIINERTQDYFNQVVDEPDPQRKEVLSLLVKEFRIALMAIHNICTLKDNKKDNKEPYTGV